MVVFKAKGPTWVKVVDSKGIVLLSKTIVNGEVVGASGATPLSVVIGRVDATDVEVRGKPFTLTGVSKDNVARFEVK
jgi:cytoskeleton protein RodZ